MLVLTTIYFADTASCDEQESEHTLEQREPATDGSETFARELLSLYEGKNRVLRLDLDK